MVGQNIDAPFKCRTDLGAKRVARELGRISRNELPV
ncbi:hypothetical protein ABIB00_006331 [Bradyrhizobium sp. LB14.3]